MENKIIRPKFNRAIDEIEQPEEVLNKIFQFFKNPKGFLVLAGPNGTGKSFAARSIMDSLPYGHFDACAEYQSPMTRLISQADLNIAWQKQMAEWKETSYLVNQYKFIKLLVLDDLGTRVPTEAFMDFLYAIIDSRYNNSHNVGTIITTNLNAKDMRKKFGDPIVSRISSGICVRIEGKDRRDEIQEF